MPKLVTLNAAGDAATVAEAKPTDILTTAVSTTSAVTGTYGLIQKAALVGLGMAVQNNRLGRGWNPISVA